SASRHNHGKPFTSGGSGSRCRISNCGDVIISDYDVFCRWQLVRLAVVANDEPRKSGALHCAVEVLVICISCVMQLNPSYVITHSHSPPLEIQKTFHCFR